MASADGASCTPALQALLAACLKAQSDYVCVVNGRFKGGYITRHYARPEQGVQTVQLELAQLNYMDEESFAYDEAKATRLQPLILSLLRLCVA